MQKEFHENFLIWLKFDRKCVFYSFKLYEILKVYQLIEFTSDRLNFFLQNVQHKKLNISMEALVWFSIFFLSRKKIIKFFYFSKKKIWKNNSIIVFIVSKYIEIYVWFLKN
jgi:hypothetical protein